MFNSRNIFKNVLDKAVVALSACVALCCTCCTEDIDRSNRYTFLGETIVDYLENRSETFGSFLYILDKARIGKVPADGDLSKMSSARHLLSTYGHYTCFAPTNAAIEKHLVQQYEKWLADSTALANGEMNQKDFRDTGIHSPLLEELSDSMCAEIFKNHVLERNYRTIDLTDGAFPSPNMNDRYITMTYMADETTGAVYPFLNYSAKIVVADQEVENGIMQEIDAVINPSTALLPDLLISQTKYFNIWSKILEMTALDSAMRQVEDMAYANGGLAGEMVTGSAYLDANPHHNTKCFYPPARKFKYTMLVEPDSIFKKCGISDEYELIKRCEEWYGTEAPGEYDNPKNALYKFVAYHILDRQLLYASGTGSGGFIMENFSGSYKSEEMMYGSQFDRHDYFETKLPYTLMKVTRPFTNDEYHADLVLNYTIQMTEVAEKMSDNINIRVYSPSTILDFMPDFKDDAMNGRLHPIDKVLVYNEDLMVGSVLRERMRWDFTSWFPELTNNNVRWYNATSEVNCFKIPDGYLERAKFRSTTSENFYLCPQSGWYNYQGDEMLASETFDIEYRMPYVPAGTYELRFGYTRYPNRSVVQFYIDGKPAGIPVDLKRSDDTEAFIGWVADSQLEDEQAIAENDKEMHNRCWMKAPDSYKVASSINARASNIPMRYVLGIFHLTEGDHWFRMKNVLEAKDTQGQHDYFEIVPKVVISDPSKPEDRH